MTTALCIIDMQNYFKASREVEEEVIHEIRLAKRRMGHIIVLEYEYYGPTLSSIKKELKNHPRVKFIKKGRDNGGPNVIGTLRWYKIDTVRVVGVNRCFCVAETAQYLQNFEDLKIEFSFNGTACDQRHHHWNEVKVEKEGFSLK